MNAKDEFYKLATEARKKLISLASVVEVDGLDRMGWSRTENGRTYIQIKNHGLPEQDEYEIKLCVLLHEMKHVRDMEMRSPVLKDPVEREVVAHLHVLSECRRRGWEGSLKRYLSGLQKSLTHQNPHEAEAARRVLSNFP